MIKVGSANLTNAYVGRRQILSVHKGSELLWNGLPEGYKKCIYLKSTGTQWIDTGIPFSTIYPCVDMELSYSPYCDYNMLFLVTCRDETSKVDGFPFVFYDDKYYKTGADHVFGLNTSGLGGSGSINKVFKFDKRFHVKEYYDLENAVVEISDGENNVNFMFKRGSNPIPDTNATIKLFYKPKVFQYKSYVRPTGSIYSLKIFDFLSGEIFVDLVPCLDGSNKPCFYNRATGETYYNQGSGEFLYEIA